MSLTNENKSGRIHKSLDERPAKKEPLKKRTSKKVKKDLTNELKSDKIDKHVWRDIEVVITRRS